MSADDQGIVEIHLNATPALAAALTRVTIEAGGQTQDVKFDPFAGSFDGSLLLPAGSQTVIARAFAGDELAGASNPATVDVQASSATRVTLRVIDLRDEPAVFGPIFDSMSAPTTTTAGVPATFSVAVVAPWARRRTASRSSSSS
jgi:hypothetical protein